MHFLLNDGPKLKQNARIMGINFDGHHPGGPYVVPVGGLRSLQTFPLSVAFQA